MYKILMHGLFHNQLMDIPIGEVNWVSPHVVQPSYMSNDNEAVEERRYKIVKELLHVTKIGMCDAKLTHSCRQARK